MSDQAKPRVITELRATAQIMNLEPGVFCVFHPGPITTDASGLPGVRISLPPNAAATPGAVQISSFREDGWLGGADSAALIRINGPRPGQVLVTVYQGPNGAEAPRLQVVRLGDAPPDAAQDVGGEPGAAAGSHPVGGAAMVPGAGGGTQRLVPSHPQPKPEDAEVAVHINRMGDVLARLGEWAGERGSKRWVEGFALSPKTRVDLADIEYQAVLGRDWLSPWSEGGQYCGSRGMSLPLLGLRARLRGAAADEFELMLEATFVNGASIGPVAAGQACETADLAALEAFKLTIVPRGTQVAGEGKAAQAAPAGRRRSEPEPEPEPEPPVTRRARRSKPELEPEPQVAESTSKRRGRAKVQPAPEPAPAPAKRRGGTRPR